MPLPQFFIREVVLPREKRTVREVVDGQQRLSAILGYVAGEFTVLAMHNTEYGKTKFDDLPEEVQKQFLFFPLSVNVLEAADDGDVLEIFARLNSYSEPLNQQEKLNAKYVGAFKQAMVELAKEHLAYWRRHQILTSRAIARMKDIEFSCELVAAMLFGLQNQKKIIGQMYGDFDDAFPQFAFVGPRFSATLQSCERFLGGDVGETAFQRNSIFYSLFAALYDLTYGLGAGPDAQTHEVNEEALLGVRDRLIDLSEALQNNNVRENPAYLAFYEATRQSTDKLPQRTARHQVLRDMLAPAFGG
jgi:hypothetical protein